jgi:hypothetical protein
VSLRGLLVAVTLTALLTPWTVTEYRAWQRQSEIRIKAGWFSGPARNPTGPTVPPYIGPIDLGK